MHLYHLLISLALNNLQTRAMVYYSWCLPTLRWLGGRLCGDLFKKVVKRPGTICEWFDAHHLRSGGRAILVELRFIRLNLWSQSNLFGLTSTWTSEDRQVFDTTGKTSIVFFAVFSLVFTISVFTCLATYLCRIA